MKYLLDTNVVIAFMRGRHSGLLERFGTVRASLSRQGQIIGPYDLPIAAIALASGGCG